MTSIIPDLQVSRIRRDGSLDRLRLVIDFTGTLNGLPIISRFDNDNVAWIEAAETAAPWEHVADDEREGYLCGGVFVDCDDYSAALQQVRVAAWDLHDEALAAIDAWSRSKEVTR